MTRYLAAELHKLRRPLVLWVGLTVVALTVFFTWVNNVNANVQNPPPPARTIYRVSTCLQLGLPRGGAACAQQRASERAAITVARQLAVRDSELAKAAQQPLGAGRFAAGYLASLVGAGALFLIAAGHLGGEWTGRTIKTLLIEDPRRWRLLLAKALSLWLAGVGLLAVTWLALAAASVGFAHKFANPTVHLQSAAAAGTALGQTGRALVVLAVYTCLAVAAAVFTRNTLGTFFLGYGFVLVNQLASRFALTGRWTLTYWVAGWMRYQPRSAPADYLWNVQFPAALPAPTPAGGLTGITLLAAVAAAVAWRRFHRRDITG